ncbi:MAG: hypothetical protein A2X36_11535 [Elusimicrobia bacterium GWA2_69_24]|nr:MAG: hypothetical protein A2X36_11535 [Elusimicrobia bacterium GWA2_69_24]HBL15418.1 hypothetical protein [Elusimicrobiota bacterium]
MILRRLLPFVLAAAALGCGRFHYYPTPPQAKKPRFPFKVSVLPFQDATEGPGITRMGIAGQCDLMKASCKPVGIELKRLTPEALGRCLALEMKSSRLFQAVEFSEQTPGLRRTDVILRGLVRRAEAVNRGQEVSLMFALDVEAVTTADSETLWRDTMILERSGPSGDKRMDQYLLNLILRTAFSDSVRRTAEGLERTLARPGGP